MRALLTRPLGWGTALGLVLLAFAALVAASTSAQDGSVCDPASEDCTPQQEQPDPTPPAAPAAPKTPPPKSPAPSPRTAPACSDGTPAPCSSPAEADAATRRRECRRLARRGIRGRGCPRLRRKRQRWERAGDRVARERRRAARQGKRPAGDEREECETLAAPTGLGDCDEAEKESLLIAGIGASRPLPDPLPPGSRLTAGFARVLVKSSGERWPLVLAVLRARGDTGAAPVGAATLKRLARTLGGRAPDERVEALADYHRAVGIEGLTNGLHAVKGDLIGRVLGDSRISIYPGGRGDVGGGRIDVRVLVTMLYLAERHGGLSVTSLISGHGVFTTSGHVSLHTFGQAMDIASVGGVPILGNQQPGGVTENVVRSVLLLPAELRPSELISLFAIGGPSFAMADHADHVHVGF